MSLQEKIDHLPTNPGVYLMKDGKGVIIYVGKAKNLKNRVLSYFRKSDSSLKTKALVAEIRDFDLILARNDVEAILLERNLIKHHQPRYNILLRDDKEFPFARIDFQEPWPRIEKVRRRRDDGATYIGPFGNAGILNTMLKTVFRVFPLIRCSRHEFANASRPCNYYHMKMCVGACCLDVDRSTYIQMLEHAVAILEGKTQDLKPLIEQRMVAAAEREQFELAAQYRDQLRALERLNNRQVAVVAGFEHADVIAYWKLDSQISFSVTQIRDFAIVANDSFLVGAALETEEDALSSFLMQYYEYRYVPDTIIIPHRLSDQKDLALALQDGRQACPKLKVGRTGEALDLIGMARKNAELHAKQSQNLSLKFKAELDLLKELLQLSQIPRRIECIDISNLQGSAIVASNVCFIDAKPAKNHYKKYTIKSLTDQSPDDYASIREVVSRRIRQGLQDDDLPDLLVIDGGKGQLNAALEAAGSFPQLNLSIVSLAKSRSLSPGSPDIHAPVHKSFERIFRPGHETPIPLEEGSPVYRLMTRIRDEAHRTAISFHRKKRMQQSHQSELDKISGIGPVIKRRLLENFAGLEGLRQASLEQIEAIPGVSATLALRIYTWAQEEQ